MKLIYDVEDKPRGGKLLAFGLQQMLAILAATIAVPMIIGNGMTPSAAMFGAGVGTIVYLLFTKFKSPVFLGSSFAFIGSMYCLFKIHFFAVDIAMIKNIVLVFIQHKNLPKTNSAADIICVSVYNRRH